MPRVARSILPDYPLHVVQRGISRADCFFQDSDYLSYLRDLRAFSERFGCSLHAYCLMTNHVHLLLTPHAQDACARLMKQLGSATCSESTGGSSAPARCGRGVSAPAW